MGSDKIRAVLWRPFLAAQWIVKGPLACIDEQMYLMAIQQGRHSNNMGVRLGDPTKLGKGRAGRERRVVDHVFVVNAPLFIQHFVYHLTEPL